MARVDKYDMPEDLYYTMDYAWARVEGNIVRIGITDFLQQMAGPITFIRLPRAGKDMEKGKNLISLQSGKWAGKVAMPINAKVVDVNKDLASEPAPLNADPYVKGWVAVIEPNNLEQGLSALLYGEAAVEWLKGEIAAHAG